MSVPRHSPPPNYAREFGVAGNRVVLVGEILAGGTAWRPHAEKLAVNWRVTTVTPVVTLEAADGHTPRPGWTIADEARVLQSFLDEAGMEKVHLGGWSLGGAIALEVATAIPERIASLTLVEAQAWWVMRALRLEPLGYEQLVRAFERFNIADVDEESLIAFLQMVGAVEDRDDPREMRGWRLAVANRQAIPFSQTVVNTQGDTATLAKLAMPVLLSGGDASQPFDQAITEGLARLIPHAERLTLPGNHTSHLTNLGAFLDRFERFLTQARF